jgi:sugar lactone lactonase YvrE
LTEHQIQLEIVAVTFATCLKMILAFLCTMMWFGSLTISPMAIGQEASQVPQVLRCTKMDREIKILKTCNLKPSLFADLGPTCKVPDAMTVDSNNNVLVSIPNFIGYAELGSRILSIDTNRKITNWFVDLPVSSKTGEVHPMGMEFGPDGNLYVADNQYFTSKDYASRLLRIVMNDGKPARCEVVVEGFKLANAVRWKGESVYVSDTFFDLEEQPRQSGVYRISLEEMKNGLVNLKPGAADSHLIARFTTKEGTGEIAGADGLCFDRDGNLYCGNFGDGVVSRTSFDATGKPVSQTVVIDHPSFTCCDGIVCDPKTNKIYLTNSKLNSVHVYSVDDHSLQVLWENDDDSGATGLLDQPCEPVIRGDELIVVNFDMPFPGLKNTVNDDHHTISVFKIR